MKLLFINGHLNTGGVEKSLVDILTHIDTSKYEVELLLLEESGDYSSLLPPEIHVTLKCLKNTYGSVGKSLLRCIRNRDWFCFRMRLIFLFMKLFGEEKISLAKKMLTGGTHYDCVIGFRRGICTQIAANAVDADRRITWWHHGEFNTDPDSYYREVKNCDTVVAVSNACKHFLSEKVPAIADRIVTIPNMLDVQQVRQKADALVPYSDPNLFHIVSVGGLVPEKHFCNAILAARELKQRGLRFQWHLVGEGCMRQQLVQQIRDAGVEDCFIMEGNQPNPYPYMKSADLFVHPSYVESQGIVVMEALALGVSCVVTESLGPCEFVEDGVNGLLTEQNADSLTEKILEILNDQDLYHRIKANSICPQQFLPEQVMGKIEKVMEGNI